MSRLPSFSNRSFHKAGLILAIGLLSQLACAQVHSFRHFGLDKNVFPSRIECIGQANGGELFIGTLAGLVVYDGHDFVQKSERDGLSENAVSAIGVYDETIWLGHWAGSLTIINNEAQPLKKIDLQAQLNYSSIVSIIPSKDTSALLLTREGALYNYSPAGLEQVVVNLKTRKETLRDLLLVNGRLYVVSDHAIYSTADSSARESWQLVYRSKEEISRAKWLQSNDWLIATKNKLSYTNTRTGESRIVHESQVPFEVISILQDQEEYIWIGTSEQGLIRYHPILDKKEFIKRDNGLSYNQVRALFLDREGSVWIATSAGLDQYLGSAFLLYDKRSGIPDNLIWDFEKVDNGVVMATNSGLFSVETETSNFKLQNTRLLDIGGAEPRKLYSIAGGDVIYLIDASGGLWFGSLEKAFKRIELSDMSVRCLEEVNGEVWVGTDNGIVRLEGDKPVEHYTRETGLGGNKVNGIYYSKVKNETWITSLGGETTLFREERFRLFGDADGLTSAVIQDAAFDKDGNPWFASYDEGVFYYKDGRFLNLSDKVNLKSNTTFAITIDEKQSVWIGHSWGLDRYRIPFEDMTSFGAEDGFMGIEVNTGAIQCDGRGDILMGTLMGLLRFSPSNFRMNISEPATRILSATIGGESILSNNEVQRLDFSNTDLKVEFKGISLTNPESNWFEYRLLGLHDDWRSKGLPTAIEYGSLAPGEYRLEVRTCNNSGHCNSNPKAIDFTIKPPFYKTWWFYSLLFILVVLAIYLMDRYRVLSLMDEKNELKEKLAEQSRVLLEMGQERDDLKAYKRYSAHMSGELIRPLMDQIPDHVKIKQINASDISSDHFLKWSYNQVELIGVLDLSVSDSVGAHFFDYIRASFYEHCLESIIKTEEDFAQAFAKTVEGAVSKFDKHKGVNWALWFRAGEQYMMALNQLSVFLLKPGEAVEISPMDNGPASFVVIDASERIFIATDGLIDQTGNDGTKVYGKKRLIAKLKEVSENSADEILDEFEQELKNWRGAMEQQDDVTLIVIDNE